MTRTKEFELEEVTLIIDKYDAEALYGIMKQIFASGIVEAQVFESKCRSCGKKIEMRNFGFGWKPYLTNSGKKHRCKAGRKAWKEIQLKKKLEEKKKIAAKGKRGDR